MIDDMDFMQYIDTLGIPYKEKGDELKFKYCPFCEGGGKSKSPYNTFSFNRSKQIYHCFHENSCGERGTLYSFKLKRGDINPITKTNRIVYKRPVVKKEILSDVDKFYKWYEEKRGIKKNILENYKVGYDKIADSKYIVYQYFNSKNELINTKHKAVSGTKKVWTAKDAEPVYYGLQFIDKAENLLIVTEGEDDCHALRQYGFNNVVSIPYGCNSYTVAMDKVNKLFERIMIIFDCDEKGQQGAYSFAQKAGLQKCFNVILPFKDSRDCILNKVPQKEIQKAIGKACQFKNETILSIKEAREGVCEALYGNINKLGVMTPHRDFNRIMKGVRPCELTILTGHTGSGKTTFAYNLACWLISCSVPVLAMSFENRISAILIKIVEIISSELVKRFDEESNKMVIEMAKETLDNYLDMLESYPLYFLNTSDQKDGYYDVDKMIDVIEYSVKFYDIKLFVIDHLHYFLKLSGAKNPVIEMDETLRKIKTATEKNNTHILLITHPYKVADKDGEPTKLGLNSGKGSSAISQEADNFLVVEKGVCGDMDSSPFSIVRMLKNREYGLTKNNEVEFLLRENLSTFYQEKF